MRVACCTSLIAMASRCLGCSHAASPPPGPAPVLAAFAPPVLPPRVPATPPGSPRGLHTPLLRSGFRVPLAAGAGAGDGDGGHDDGTCRNNTFTTEHKHGYGNTLRLCRNCPTAEMQAHLEQSNRECQTLRAALARRHDEDRTIAAALKHLRDTNARLMQEADERLQQQLEASEPSKATTQQLQQLSTLQAEHDKLARDYRALAFRYNALRGAKEDKKVREKGAARLVVLWDAENMGADYVERALEHVANTHPQLKSDGQRFAFGFKEGALAASLQKARDQLGFKWRHNTSEAKNCADLQLSVFAMQTLVAPHAVAVKKSQVYLVVSHDRDFLVLRKALEDAGKKVLVYTKDGMT